MKPEEIIYIKNLIAENHISKAINQLLEFLNDSELIDQMLIIKSNQRALISQVTAGILNFEQETQGYNRIKFDLLKLLGRAEYKEAELDLSDNMFSSSIRTKMNNLEKKVEKLTNEQYRVLRLLRNIKKVRISGCAGSGKTLVAAEKAIRLANAGLNTIFLCHNPFLTEYIKDLVKGSNVKVSSFTGWINNINLTRESFDGNWSNLHEPTSEELNLAFDKIEKNKLSYDAIIVDEGQDFRQDWWTLIELVLRDSHNSIFYIFHDDNQALLPFRCNYPIQEPVIDLSRNCRNGGKIYQLMRDSFHHQAPTVSEEMNEEGIVKIFVPDKGEGFNESVSKAIKWLVHINKINNIVILLAGDINAHNWDLSEITLKIPIGFGWKKEVRDKFIKVVGKSHLIKLTKSVNWIESKLDSLSNNDVPNKKDIRLVNDIANTFELEISSRKSPISLTKRKERIYWKNINGNTKLDYKRKDLGLWSSELIMFFQDSNWAEGLSNDSKITFSKHLGNSEFEYPVLDTSSFKGLESDGIILISKGCNDILLEQLYVGVSRAKGGLAIVVDKMTSNLFSIEN